MFRLLAFAAALLVGSFTATTIDAQGKGTESSDIVTIAVEAGSFKTLAAALEAADLVGALQGDGPFTVFAPTDEAFAKLPEGTVETLLLPENRGLLTEILKFHVVAGAVPAVDALRAGKFETLSGGELEARLDGGRLQINDATVVRNDLRASNGIIHVIDSVLLPSTPDPADPRVATAMLFEFAIDRGVPLFNDNQPAACAAIYEVAVRSVTDRPAGLSEESVAVLRKGLATLAKERDPSERAWILRRAMDASYEIMVREIQEGTEKPEASIENASLRRVESGDGDSRLVMGFDSPSRDARWFTLNDDVMGGISQSQFQFTSHGTALFSGALSLENNGGFATVRSPARNLDLAGYDGLILRVRGDGRKYRVSALRSDQRYEVRFWQREFVTTRDKWQEIRVPFDTMELRAMGRRIRGAGPIDPAQLRSISLGISDKNETPFQLEVDWIKAYRN